MEWLFTEAPKDRKILACINLCGRIRRNVVEWSDLHNVWITDMQLNHISPPICWAELPHVPNDVNVLNKQI